nr:polyprenyl synthetase family protein [Candidatus Njordarchaeota archaeon]
MMSPLDSLLADYIESINRGLVKTFKDFEVPSKWYQIAKEHVLGGGKRVRPIICMATCESLGGSKNDVFEAALAIELLHNASMIHDDIVDRDKIRRGKPTIAAQFDDLTAMLVGDLLFSISFRYASRCYSDPRIIGTLSEAVFDMVNGGSLGVKLRDEVNVTEKTYIEVAELKTAALFRAASTIGAICAGAEQSGIKLMSEFGTALGVAFQIKDDLLGLIGKEQETGKPVNSDLRNREKTLIAIHALNSASGNDAEILRRFFTRNNCDGIHPDKIKEIFERVGSIDYAIDRSWSLANRAKSMIAILDNQAKNLLSHLCDFAVTRIK